MNITLIPRSEFAKGVLANELNGDPVIEIVQIGDGRVFVYNPRLRFATWIHTKGDPDWDFTLAPPTAPPSPPVSPS